MPRSEKYSATGQKGPAGSMLMAGTSPEREADSEGKKVIYPWMCGIQPPIQSNRGTTPHWSEVAVLDQWPSAIYFPGFCRVVQFQR